MYIEEPPLSEDEKVVVIIEQDDFLELIQQKYNLSLSTRNSKNLYDDFERYIEEVASNTTRKKGIENSDDRFMVYEKWFYFCNILATTIGKSLWRESLIRVIFFIKA